MATTTISVGTSIKDTINAASAGDTIRLNDGTYVERVSLSNLQFPDSNPVVVEAVNEGMATIDGAYGLPGGTFATIAQGSTTKTINIYGGGTFDCLGYVWGAMLHLTNCRAIHFNGINIFQSRGRGMTLDDSRNIKFLNGYIKSCRNAAIVTSGSKDIELAPTEVWDCANFAPVSRTTGEMNWPVVIFPQNGSEDIHLHDSWVWGNWGEGIGSGLGGNNFLMQDLYVGPNFAMGVYMHFGFGVTLDRSILFHDASTTFNRGGSPSNLVVFARENANFPNEGASGDMTMSNCMLIARTDGVALNIWNNQGVGAASGKNTIINNLMYSTTGTPLKSIGNVATAHTDTSLINNIFERTDGGNPYDDNAGGAQPINGSSFTWDYNVWSILPPASMRGSNDVTGHVTLASAVAADSITAGTKPDPLNYKITAPSNANDAGTATIYPEFDFFGTLRVSPIDVGPHHLPAAGETGDPPIWDSLPGNQFLIDGTAFTGAISATDPDLDTLTYGETGLPPGLSLNTSSGAITGTPTAPGTYTVFFTVTDTNYTITHTAIYTVAATSTSVTAAFTYVIGDGGLVDFTDASTASGTTITSWRWDFGDGTISTLQSPSHTYSPATGEYTVSLRVDDGGDGTDLLTNGDLETGLQSPWSDYDPTNNASILSGGAVDTDYALTIDSSGAGNTQLYQSGISLTNTTAYTVKFWAKGAGTLRLKAIQHGTPYANLGLDEYIPMTAEWSQYIYTFVATATEADSRLQFAYFGSYTLAVITIDEVQFFDADDVGEQDSTTQVLTFTEPVVMGLSLDVTTGDAPLDVEATDSSVVNEEGLDIDTHKVLWGDGDEDTITIGGTAIHTYDDAGSYTATVRLETL